MSMVTDFTWELSLSMLPRKCSMTQQKIPMFTAAYKGKHEIIDCGPAQTFVIQIAWISPQTFMYQKLKGNIK